MAQTMTWIGLDVHARSVHAAIVDARRVSCAAVGSAARSTRSRLPRVPACAGAGGVRGRPDGLGWHARRPRRASR